jgi:glutaconate CoA-transferase subunit B
VITDLGVLEPDPDTRELTLTEVLDGVAVDDVVARTGWELRVADQVGVIAVPREDELAALRELLSR